MDSGRQKRVERAREAGVCPECGRAVSEGQAVGSGSHADGRFCSLDCYATFHQERLEEKAKRTREARDN